MNCLIWVCSVLFLCAVYCDEQVEYTPTIQVNGGKVRGIVQKSEDGQKVDHYMGIRYGQAERFAKPSPVAPWTGLYNATTWRDACPQTGFDKPPYGPGAQTSTMSEDCLFLNIWRPAEEKVNSTRAVMFWMHGGSFEHGTIFSLLYDGRYLASHGDVIVVTVNYRLGTFGWLYGDTPELPGNLGLHDQILALKWVHENIAHFGGDPNRVTVFGESSGAFSVSAFVLSPLTKGLFRRAILQSGAPSSTTTNAATKPLNRTIAVAKLAQCPNTATVLDSVHCLRNKTIDEILNAQKIAGLFGQTPTPVFEDEILPMTNAVDALRKGKYNRDVDFMYGVTQDEGSIFVGSVFSELDSNATVLTVESTRKYILKIYASLGEVVSKEIADFYTANLHNATQTQLRHIISEAFGAPNLVCATILFGEHVAKLSTNNAHHYSYQLTQPTTIPFPLLGGCEGWRGVCHGEDVVYLMGTGLLSKHPADYQLSKDIIGAWTNFAKTGQPGKLGSVEWKESIDATNHYSQIMNLNTKDYRMVKDYFKEECNTFWGPKLFF